ncbi:LysR family transcriptional regulator [Vibrio sinaloensis]|nr:LysR family transcriptional regulator [Vibrio sinaloensis]
MADKRSFTLAADDLNIGKARVSQIVTRLELELNTRLLHRTTRSLSLTDSGVAYYQKCLAISELAHEANTEIQKRQSGATWGDSAINTEHNVSLCFE